MKILALFISLVFYQQGFSYVMMDENTLTDDDISTLIYVIGCGEWEDFTFSVDENNINASANIPDDWVNCQVDPAPLQFWNRLPLTQLSAGAYVLNLTLFDTTQATDTIQLNFTVMGSIPMVPVNNKITLTLLILIFLVVVYRKMTLG